MDDNYVALVVTLVIWFGLFAFVWRLDKQVKRLEKKKD